MRSTILFSNHTYSSVARVGAILAALLATCSPTVATAQTVRTWNITTGTWSDAGSWDGGNIPTASDTAFFSGATVGPSNATALLGGPTSILGLSFNNSGTTTIRSDSTTARTLTLGTGGITMASTSGPVTLGVSGSLANILLGSTQTWTNSSSGPLTVAGTIDTDAGVTSTLTLAGSGSTTLSGIISGATGRVISLVKQGTGSLTLSGSNSFTGATSVLAGTLTLDYATQNSSKLSDTASLTLGGGGNATVSLAGGSHAETVLSTTLSGGASTISRASGSGTINLNEITRSTGATLNVEAASIATTDLLNTNGILGGWATVNNAGWAVNSTNAADGAITALATYATNTWASGSNTNVTGNITPAADAVTNSLRFNTATSSTVTLSGTSTIESGGILVSSAVGSNLSTITGGALRGSSGGDLVVHQNASGGLTIASQIVDNTSATALTKSGGNTLTLSGSNAYSGGTFVNAGTLVAANGHALGSGTITLAPNGTTNTLDLNIANVNWGNAVATTAAAGTVSMATSSGTAQLGSLTINANQTIRGNFDGPTTMSFSSVVLNGNAAFTTRHSNGVFRLGGISEDDSPRSVTIQTPTTLTGSSSHSGGTILAMQSQGNFTTASADYALGSGTLTINVGTLSANTANALRSSADNTPLPITIAPNGGLTLGLANTSWGNNITTTAAAGTINIYRSGSATLGSLTINGNQTIQTNSGNALSFTTLALGGNATFQTLFNNGTVAIGGITESGGSRSLAVGGAEYTVTGSNSYSGGTVVNNSATLRADANHALGSGAITINNGGTLRPGTAHALRSSVDNAPLAITMAPGATLDLSGLANTSATLGNLSTTASTGTVSLTIPGTGVSTASFGDLAINGAQTIRATASGSGTSSFSFNAVSVSQDATFFLDARSGVAATMSVSSIGETGGSRSVAFSHTDSNFASGSGRYIVTGSSAYTGTTTITNQSRGGLTFQIGAGGSSGSLRSTAGILMVTTTTGPTTLSFNSTGDYGGAYEMPISGTGSLSVQAGRLTLAGTNSYTGNTTIDRGVLVLSTTAAVSGTAARPYTVNAAGVLATDFPLDQIATKVATASAGVLAISGNSNTTLDFSSAGANLTAASLGAVGAGTWAYTGTLTPNGTVYRLGGGGGTLDFQSLLSGGRTLTVGGDLAGLGGTVILSSATNSYGGATTVQRGILQISSLTNAGSNSSTGTNASITLSSGTSTGTLRYVGSGNTSNRTINIQGTVGGTLDASGSGALDMTSGTISAAANTVVTLTGTSTANNTMGVIAGTGASVNKTGPGLWRLSGANSYSGQLTVSDGTVVVAANVGQSGNSPFGTATDSNLLPIIGSSAASLSGTAALLVDGNWTLERGMSIAALGAGSSQVAVLGVTGANSAIFGDSITLGRGVTLQASSNGTVTFANNWVNASGPVAFTIGSAGNDGVVVLESELPTSTGVSIVRGTARLQTSTNDRINPATPVTVGSGLGAATLDINGQSQTLSNLSFAGNSGSITGGTLRLASTPAVAVTGTGHTISSLVALDAAAGFNVNAASRLGITSAISGGFGLTKTGAGVLELSAANTYAGPTLVSGGSLLVNGSLASAVTVQSGGLLGGSGTLNGGVSIEAGGTLSPGNSPGLLTTSELVLAGATLMEIDGLAPRGGIGGYDAVNVTGALTYGGSLLIDFGSSITSAFADNTSFNLFDFGSYTSSFSSITTANDGSFYAGLTFASTGAGDKWTAAKGSQTLEFTHSTGVLVIVPEPGAIALAGIGIAAAAYANRRRRCL